MKNKKIRIPIEADIKAKLSDLDKVVQGFNSKLKELKIDPSKNATFTNLFKNYKKAYEDFEQYVQGTDIDLMNAPKAIKSGHKVLEIFEQIKSKYGDLSNLSLDSAKKMFPDAFAEKVKDGAKAIGDYEKAVEKLDTKKIELRKIGLELDSLRSKINEINGTKLKTDIDLELETAKKQADEAALALQNFYDKAQKAFEKKAKNRVSEVEKFTKEDGDLEVAQYKEKRSQERSQTSKTKREFDAETDAEVKAIIRRNKQKIEAYENYQKALIKAEKDAAEKIKAVQAGDTSGLTKKQREELEKLKETSEKATISISDLQDEQKKAFKTEEERAAALAKANLELDTATIKYNNLKKEIDELTETGDIENLFKKLTELNIPTEGIEHSADGIKQIQRNLENLDDATLKQIKKALEDMGFTADETEDFVKLLNRRLGEMDETADDIRKTDQEMENLRQQVLDFFSIGNAVEIFKNAIRDAFDTIKELDAVMTEAAVVTDYSVGDMWDKLPQYTEEANKLGVAIKDLYGATTLYYQQGLGSNEATELGIETLKMAKIANMEATEATQAMTAALRGFNMEINGINASRINDVYSKLAAVTAADTSQIATAMSKTASIASAANMEFETTAAFLAQIIETTQEAPETAGTALKTIIARFSEVKKLAQAGEATGADEEGEEIDVNKISEALRMIGISMDDFFAGTEGLDSVFLKLSEKWDTLDVTTQRYIATVAAGSRQQSRFLAMMGDYDRTMELVADANNSAGASQEQFSKTMESLDSKLQRLKNAWNEFVMNLTNSDLVKGAVDFVTSLLEQINNLTDTLSGGNGLIKSLVTITELVIGLKTGGAIFRGLFPSTDSKGVLSIIQIVSKFFDIANQKPITGTLFSLIGSLQGGGILKTVLGLLAKINPYLLAITATIGVIASIVSKINAEKPENKIKKIEENLSSLSDRLAEASSEVENFNNAWDALTDKKAALDGLTKGTTEWKAALLEVNNSVLDLIETYPELVDYLGKDSSGQLFISEEGYKVLLEKQQNEQDELIKELEQAQKDKKYEQARSNYQGFKQQTGFQFYTFESANRKGIFGNEKPLAEDIQEKIAIQYAQLLRENNIQLSGLQVRGENGLDTAEYTRAKSLYGQALSRLGLDTENYDLAFTKMFEQFAHDKTAATKWDTFVKSFNLNTLSAKANTSVSLQNMSSESSVITEIEDVWENSFDRLYNLVADIESETRQRERIERKYQSLIENVDATTTDILAVTEEEIENLQQQKEMQLALQAARRQQIAQYTQQNKDLQKYANVRTGQDGELALNIDWNAIQRVTDETLGSRIEDYVSQLEEWFDSIYDAEQAIYDIEDSLEDIKERGKQEYLDLEEKIKNAVIYSREKEIEELELINDSINEAGDGILDSIKKQIDKQRQQRQNDKTSEEISDQRRRLAYLQQDTSGANALEIMALEKEIQEKEQNYTDTLIDQKLSQLQEQNDEAAEQRAHQIEIAQNQLDYLINSGAIWKEVERLMNEGLSETEGLVKGSELETLLKSEAGFEGMSDTKQMDWLDSLQLQVQEALVHLKGIKEGDTGSSGETDLQELEQLLQKYLVSDEELNKEPKNTKSFRASTTVDAEFWGGHGLIPIGSVEGKTPKEAKVLLEKEMDRQMKEEIQKIKSSKHYKPGDEVYVEMAFEEAKKKIRVSAFKTGGLADFTGPAWLDGTKSRPEYVLNADQTERFFKLIDILDSFKSNLSTMTSQVFGGATYDIDINIDTVKEEADVDMIVDKVQKSIVSTTRYRSNIFATR